jgi:hypothetical protein
LELLEEFFGAGAAKAAHTDALRPHTVKIKDLSPPSGLLSLQGKKLFSFSNHFQPLTPSFFHCIYPVFEYSQLFFHPWLTALFKGDNEN